MNIEQTQRRTHWCNGIEYNELPPPVCLVKAMSKKYASNLVKRGELKIHHLSYFRAWEDKVLGDPNDGKGLYHVNGHPMDIRSANDVYAWCTSFPEITIERLHLIAEQGKYDCMIVVRNPQVIFERINNWLSENQRGFLVHCGEVKYSRGDEVDKETLNSQKFHFNVFQKDVRFKDDKEYRLSVTNSTFRNLEKKYIKLVLGDCSDVVTIEELPDKVSNMDSSVAAFLTGC